MKFISEALNVLHECIVDGKFTASPVDHDNYRRVWSRDSVLAGLSAVLLKDIKGLNALRESVLQLGRHQSELGQIPSNVSLDEKTISYGSLVGRVDATTWWIIGACWVMDHFPKEQETLCPKIERAFHLLECWEMNGRGLIYTPVGGNWADEYISQGYVLYDQCLRLWALRAYAHFSQEKKYCDRAESLTHLLKANFSFSRKEEKNLYHPVAYERAWEALPYWAMSLGAQGYDKRWDMAANALVLLLGLEEQPEKMENFLLDLMNNKSMEMLPVFYPIIQETDPEWHFLNNNFLYQFKNKPHHFHNGGSWPVFIGLLCLGFSSQNRTFILSEITEQIESKMNGVSSDVRFSEYWNTSTFEVGGVPKLAFSASGYLMMSEAQKINQSLQTKLKC
jgi:hypothetical protein